MKFELDIPMTWRELRYLLFAKKSCPSCRGVLSRSWKTIDEGFAWRKSREGLDLRLDYSHKTTANVSYECRACRAWFPISELAG